jgi:hypothetical protein
MIMGVRHKYTEGSGTWRDKLPMFFKLWPQYRRCPWHFPDLETTEPTRVERAKMKMEAYMVSVLCVGQGCFEKVVVGTGVFTDVCLVMVLCLSTRADISIYICG